MAEGSEVFEDLQVFLGHGGVFFPVVLWVNIKVGGVALMGNLRNYRRLETRRRNVLNGGVDLQGNASEYSHTGSVLNSSKV